jgi:hypothetical protein
MKISNPRLKSTITSSDTREWIPSSLDNFLKEIDNISKIGHKNDSLILYRGQNNNNWPLDSTFVRKSITALFGIKNYFDLPPSIRHRISFHRSIASLFLMKFDKIIKPSEEAFTKESSHGIDSYFELLKHVQQYPEKYLEVPFIKGTNLIDWTNVFDIALYFAVFEGQEGNRKISDGHGALWIYDASSTGGIWQTGKMKKTMDLMTSGEFLNGERTFPLMFHPQKQTNQHRAFNQKPVYIGQMDFRYDLADVWASYENQNDKRVFIKLILSDDLKISAVKYLESNGVTEDLVYPE